MGQSTGCTSQKECCAARSLCGRRDEEFTDKAPGGSKPSSYATAGVAQDGWDPPQGERQQHELAAHLAGKLDEKAMCTELRTAANPPPPEPPPLPPPLDDCAAKQLRFEEGSNHIEPLQVEVERPKKRGTEFVKPGSIEMDEEDDDDEDDDEPEQEDGVLQQPDANAEEEGDGADGEGAGIHDALQKAMADDAMLTAWMQENMFDPQDLNRPRQSRRQSQLGQSLEGLVKPAALPILVAVDQHRADIVGLLMKAGADPTQRDASGRNAWQLAKKAGKDGEEVLLKLGEEPAQQTQQTEAVKKRWQCIPCGGKSITKRISSGPKQTKDGLSGTRNSLVSLRSNNSVS